MKKYFFFLSFFFPLFALQAQLSSQERIEIPLSLEFKNEKIQILGENSFLLRSEGSLKQDGQKEWRYEFFDEALASQGSQSIYLPKSFYLARSINQGNQHHAIFKNKWGEYRLLSLDVGSRKKFVIKGKLGRKSRILQLRRLGENIYMSIREGRSNYLLIQNWKYADNRFISLKIPKVLDKDIRLWDMQVLKESKEVLLYLKVRIHKPERKLYILSLQTEEEKQELFELALGDGRFPISISASKRGQAYIFSGTYNPPKGNHAEGLYFSTYEDTQASFTQSYAFAELENFYGYLSSKRKEKLERKRKQRKAEGKDFLPQYRVAAHRLMPLEDGFLFLGEAFYPTYVEECVDNTTTCPDGTSTTTTTCDDEFDGYQYTHAVIVKFDFEGNKLWDQCFSMWPSIKPRSTRKFIRIEAYNSYALNMLFVNNHQLISKSISYENGEVLQEKERENIFTGFEGDQTRKTWSNLSYWYDHYFLAYGRQRIKNPDNAETEQKREVFFINKVGY